MKLEKSRFIGYIIQNNKLNPVFKSWYEEILKQFSNKQVKIIIKSCDVDLKKEYEKTNLIQGYLFDENNINK